MRITPRRQSDKGLRFRNYQNIPGNMDAILESFKVTLNALAELRRLGLISVTVRISFLLIVWLFANFCIYCKDLCINTTF